MTNGWTKGSTRAWRRIRALVLTRDQGKGCRAHNEGWCARAGVGAHGCTNRAEHAHHTLGRARTGDDPRYIVAACSACNLIIGDPAKKTDPPGRSSTKW